MFVNDHIINVNENRREMQSALERKKKVREGPGVAGIVNFCHVPEKAHPKG